MAKKISYPKNIARKKDRPSSYQIEIFSKKDKKKYYIGCTSSIQEAIKIRDEWLVKNYQLVEGYLPRGIVQVEGKYKAQISTTDLTYHIGIFDTLQEAVDYRTKFILGLL